MTTLALDPKSLSKVFRERADGEKEEEVVVVVGMNGLGGKPGR